MSNDASRPVPIMLNTLFWLAVLISGVLLEAVALYFQYGLDYGPCVLCIHIRIYIAGFILLALAALLIERFMRCNHARKAAPLVALALSAGLAERSWKTLAVERNWIQSACDMNSGLPEWFALDKWFPTLFEPWEPCGYTPEVLFGITMAEGLMALSVAAVLTSLGMIWVNWRR